MAASTQHIRSLTALAIILIATTLGCGGSDPVKVSILADEQVTLDEFQRQNPGDYAFCHVLDSAICQSPDSALVFHMPRELAMEHAEKTVLADIIISNEGRQEIILEEYFIRAFDQFSQQYHVSFVADNEYDETHPFEPALRLMPDRQTSVRFVIDLRTVNRAVKRVAIVYKRPADLDYQRVVVSYTTRGLDALDARDDYWQQ